MILTAALAVPLLGAVALAFWRGWSQSAARLWAIGISVIPLVAMAVAWWRFDTSGTMFQLVEEVEWVPSLGMGFRLGVDGIALAVAAMSALLFTGAAAYPVDTRGSARQYYAWILFLEAASLGVFLALDLLLFYVFFDLTLVAMYFLIAGWGHGKPQRAALKFFIYTLFGSLFLLLAILGLYLATDPLTFDMRELIARQPLAGAGAIANVVMAAFLLGFIIKTPLAPFHTWLPSAHVDAPAPASAILAGVLLKMGTYGLIRIPYSMMADTFAEWALPLAVLALISIIYGSLVALGQKDIKRRIAYTSINHMGYAVLGIAAAGALLTGSEAARSMALTGATIEMVAHGLITGSLFLITGSFWQRGETYDFAAYGGLSAPTPKLAALTTLAAFASLGLPGLAGFVAEFHILVGTFGVYPWLAAIALLGLLITAALFLRMLQSLFFGQLPERWKSMPDLNAAEFSVLGILLLLVVVIGVYPAVLIDLIETSTGWLVGGQ
ncbi:NAD(P)H-quinone oxidoreductase subunit D4 [Streptosporangium jomthongense]|uniref:NADH-quinone oxidoreductase subunit M n=1 Tax=Marinobacter aromaticivorans TaxID=1494078 RepID=A0ABW2IXW9_9GAMM|nr:NADH-quinone oxidoreductase subunit M [Marinobacter aromaticivorans]GGE73799.1 NAD(P)H-quinone oxidoreductase subunit D4 [Streptosporangium jomthongense]